MKHLIRYLLDGDGSVPKFVEDGGYFPLDNELVGISIDDSVRYLPPSVHKVTRAELIARATTIGHDEPESDVDTFLTAKGF